MLLRPRRSRDADDSHVECFGDPRRRAANAAHAEHEEGVRPKTRERIANRVRNRISDDTIQDSGCTFRAFRRECLRGLVLYRGFHRFVPTLLRMRGYRVIEVPENLAQP